MRPHVSNFLMYFLIMLLTMLQPIQAQADEQARIRDTYACRNATIALEQEYQIQEHLLTTISNVETGRWDSMSHQVMAWPWTVNAKGKGTFYPSKKEAIRAVRKLQSQGIKSIDVGCMQINLAYHPDAFKNLEEAFDPRTNVAYSAKFLTRLYENRGGDWIKAAMAYHSSVPKKALRYRKKIVSAFEKVKQAQKRQDATSVKLASTGHSNNRRSWLKKTTMRSNPKRDARLIAEAHAWREARLAEYHQNKKR